MPTWYQICSISNFIALLFQWIPSTSDWSYHKSSKFKLDMQPNKPHWSQQPWTLGNSDLDPDFAAGLHPCLKCKSESKCIATAHIIYRKHSIQHTLLSVPSFIYSQILTHLFTMIPKFRLFCLSEPTFSMHTSFLYRINSAAVIWIPSSPNNCFASE